LDPFIHERYDFMPSAAKGASSDLRVLMGLLERLARLDPRRTLRLQLEKVRSLADALVVERDAYLRQRDVALGERNELRRQLDIVVGEHKELLHQRDQALGERNEVLWQRDGAISACNGLRRQLAERIEQWEHRTDMAARRGRGRPAMTRERLLLFLHLTKTGGVTLNNIIVRNLSIGEYLVIAVPPRDDSALWTWSNAEVRRALAALTPEAADRIRAVLGHYGPSVQRHLPKPCAVVTMLRDPVERLLSYFYYDVHRGMRPAALFEEFVEEGKDLALDNYMTRILSGIGELDPADKAASLQTHAPVDDAAFAQATKTVDKCLIAGTTDQFDETLLVLAADLGWSLTDLVYQPGNVTSGRRATDDLRPGVRERLLQMNQYDVDLLAHARAHLARRIAAYHGDFDRDLSLFRELNSLFQRGTPTEELRRIERHALGEATDRQWTQRRS
jgi:Galactose-3-O-sulfotransferase